MEALLEALILKYGEPIARKLLGLEQRSQNPKYAISLGNMKIDPMRMLANQGMKGIMSGGKMSSMMGPGLLLGGALGLGYLTNPLREGSYNYNPNLQGQIDYASGRGYIGKNSGSGLAQYTDKSVLSGQNVVSGFGTNDYVGQLDKYIEKMMSYATRSKFQQAKLDRAIAEKKAAVEKKAAAEKKALEEFNASQAAALTREMARQNQRDNTGGYQAGYGGDFMDGGDRGRGNDPDDKGGSDSMGSFARGGRVRGSYFNGGIVSLRRR